MNLWKTKLAALLHDPPSKALDIPSHQDRAQAAFRRAGFIDTEIGRYYQDADHIAAAESRLPFPSSSKSGLRCAFDGVRNRFLHPLSADPLPFDAEFASASVGFHAEETSQPCLSDKSLQSLGDEASQWRARFFAHWRLWPRQCARQDYRMAFLPADTRIPDHTIWCHMQVVSAFAACRQDSGPLQPAFLRFQLGPVQDYIAAARSHRDLWSGSYLLSWLMAAGLKALSAEIGPDAVIFPNLREQPLFDLHWRRDLWDRVRVGEGAASAWHDLYGPDSPDARHTDFLTPNLPNVFLALVPSHRATDLGRLVERAIRDEWKRIAQSVWDVCSEHGLTGNEPGITAADREARFQQQVDSFLALQWMATPWPDSLEAVEILVQQFAPTTPSSPAPTDPTPFPLPIQVAWDRVRAVIDMATRQMPESHRDGRFYHHDPQNSVPRLSSVGLAWSVVAAWNASQLDAVRQTRTFGGPPGGWSVGTFCNKDALTGREEAVAGGQKWEKQAESTPFKYLFKDGAFLSAPTLIKRLWHLAYLQKEPWNLRTGPKDFPMPDTREVASHQARENEDDPIDLNDTSEDPRYFAVLAFDGDEIGKWISGEKTPEFKKLLASYSDGSDRVPQGALEYFQRDDLHPTPPDSPPSSLKDRFASFLKTRRTVFSGFHLQFSEALGNFARHCARPIVEAFDGHLIYAGGDDVLAVLPADTALACAAALRAAFRGCPTLPDLLRSAPQPSAVAGLTVHHPGFIVRDTMASSDPTAFPYQDQRLRPIPLLVPGPKAHASVGIAIAHFKTPLQDVVRAAREAEKRAKRKPKDGGHDRQAAAVTLMKRSGEIIHWGTKWDAGLDFYQALLTALQKQQLAGKFCHRWIQLLEPYLAQPSLPCRSTELSAQAATDTAAAPAFDARDVILAEFKHVLSRQRGPQFPQDPADRDSFLNSLRQSLERYLAAILPSQPTQDSINPDPHSPFDPQLLLLRAVIGLCQTCAFAHRTQRDLPDHAAR